MNFYGLQKMTLLDFPGKVACTVFTGGCNLRCPFCHNALLVTKLNTAEKISVDDFLDFLKKRTGLLDGVCITGGEPLINDDIEQVIFEIKKLGFLVKLDTNGCYPDKLKSLIDKGLLDYIAMDIKNSTELYCNTTGVKDSSITDSVKESISIILSSAVDYEFRTTVVKNFHSIESISNAASLISGANRYFLQNFVDSGDLIGDSITGFSKSEMEQLLEAAKIYVPNTQLRGI